MACPIRKSFGTALTRSEHGRTTSKSASSGSRPKADSKSAKASSPFMKLEGEEEVGQAMLSGNTLNFHHEARLHATALELTEILWKN